jgi:hypothetical protein
MDLGSEAIALVEALKGHVADLERVGTEPGRWGEQLKPEITAYLGALFRVPGLRAEPAPAHTFVK